MENGTELKGQHINTLFSLRFSWGLLFAAVRRHRKFLGVKSLKGVTFVLQHTNWVGLCRNDLDTTANGNIKQEGQQHQIRVHIEKRKTPSILCVKLTARAQKQLLRTSGGTVLTSRVP